ncbi:response regulator [Methylomonas fluvii]|nr:response regulator [Methylomonas fluvii]
MDGQIFMSSNQTVAPATILIVDDTPENITTLGDLLKPYCNVRVAINGPRALALANADPHPDLILLDVMMPEMDGYTVLSRLRKNPAPRHRVGTDSQPTGSKYPPAVSAKTP